MIIVSQDKSVIVNFNNVEAIEIGNKGTIYARLVSEYFYKIGEYKTEERAKEVLREIINAIKGKNSIVMNTEELRTEISGNLYEMPED